MFWTSHWLIYFSIRLTDLFQYQTDWSISVSHWLIYFSITLTDLFQYQTDWSISVSHWLIYFSIRLTDLFQYQSDWSISVSDWLIYFSITLTDLFQYQSQFIDTDNIILWYKSKNVKITSKIEILLFKGGITDLRDICHKVFFSLLKYTCMIYLFQGTNEILRMFVALSGCQHAGKQLKELIK
jgi:hypothetical protein